MIVLLMAAIGFIAGFALDLAIARLAREPYETDDGDGDAAPATETNGTLELSSETGAFAMPRALTTGAGYRTAVVVAVTTALFALVGLQYEGDSGHLAIVAAYVAVLVICTGTDVLAYRVPNVVTYPAIAAALAIGMTMSDANRGDVAAGGLVTGGTFLVMAVVTRGGMGMGDVKLSLFTGFALGLELGIQAMLITAIAGGVIAVFLLATKIRSRRDPIPYAPFLALGAIYILLARGTAFVEL